MEVKLYNKYAYDYLYTRDGEEEKEEKQKREARRKRFGEELIEGKYDYD